MEIARDEVRVMTVHGAKGLEAPVVILADTMTPPSGPRPPRLLELPGGPIVWSGRKDDDPPPVAAARQAARSEAEHEYRRLLYVAMTRAADLLIVCGAEGLNKPPQKCWYDLVREPLKALLVEEDSLGEKVLRYRKTAAEPAANTAAPAAQDETKQRELPSWLREAAAAAARLPAMVSPASAFADEIERGHEPVAPGLRRKALERGRLVHRLLQSLPDVPPQRRGEAARTLSVGRRPWLYGSRKERHRAKGLGDPRRSKIRADFCAGKPRRGADRRPHRARRRGDNRCVRPGRPVGGDHRHHSDCRLQD